MNRPGSLKGWALVPQPRPAARLRLFCFPYAGGGASVFTPWARELPDAVEMVAVQPPGREGRLMEQPIGDMAEMVAAMHRELAPWMDRPFAFFGHSNGGLMAFELTRSLRCAGGPMPRLLITSGRPAPQLPLLDAPIHALPDAEFLDTLRRFNGTPEEVLANREIMELLMPMLRADFRLGEAYTYTAEAPLALPLVAWGGQRDDEVPAAHVEAWREQAGGEFRFRMFPGDHFFLHGDRALVLRSLNEELRAVLARAPAHAF
ncbi:MAG TPA: alpha/beta fold hydrolase [Longimicrobium sp.]|uniref:thioesterase II family protein n=1 Tax=Longimicrobium sp. TaxID=2029185 RepID=UPI002EDA2342